MFPSFFAEGGNTSAVLSRVPTVILHSSPAANTAVGKSKTDSNPMISRNDANMSGKTIGHGKSCSHLMIPSFSRKS